MAAFGKECFFYSSFPENFKRSKYDINILEFFSIIICLKLWGQFFCQKRSRVYCDNLAVVTVVNSGKSKCEILQMCLRELAFIEAINQFEIRAINLGSNENRIADHLSRWNLSECHRQQLYELTSEYDELFEFVHTW